MDSFRLASQYCNDVAAALRCRAQGAAMMRQMQSTLRTLINMQSVRRRAAAEKQPVARPKTQYRNSNRSLTPSPRLRAMRRHIPTAHPAYGPIAVCRPGSMSSRPTP
jgi:hypothetical protein